MTVRASLTPQEQGALDRRIGRALQQRVPLKAICRANKVTPAYVADIAQRYSLPLPETPKP